MPKGGKGGPSAKGKMPMGKVPKPVDPSRVNQPPPSKFMDIREALKATRTNTTSSCSTQEEIAAMRDQLLEGLPSHASATASTSSDAGSGFRVVKRKHEDTREPHKVCGRHHQGLQCPLYLHPKYGIKVSTSEKSRREQAGKCKFCNLERHPLKDCNVVKAARIVLDKEVPKGQLPTGLKEVRQKPGPSGLPKGKTKTPPAKVKPPQPSSSKTSLTADKSKDKSTGVTKVSYRDATKRKLTTQQRAVAKRTKIQETAEWALGICHNNESMSNPSLMEWRDVETFLMNLWKERNSKHGNDLRIVETGHDEETSWIHVNDEHSFNLIQKEIKTHKEGKIQALRFSDLMSKRLKLHRLKAVLRGMTCTLNELEINTALCNWKAQNALEDFTFKFSGDSRLSETIKVVWFSADQVVLERLLGQEQPMTIFLGLSRVKLVQQKENEDSALDNETREETDTEEVNILDNQDAEEEEMEVNLSKDKQLLDTSKEDAPSESELTQGEWPRPLSLDSLLHTDVQSTDNIQGDTSSTGDGSRPDPLEKQS